MILGVLRCVPALEFQEVRNVVVYYDSEKCKLVLHSLKLL